MARLLTPERTADPVTNRMPGSRPNESAKEAFDAARDALERAGRSIEKAAAAVPEPSAIGDRLPSPASLMAGLPGAVEIARRLPSLREVRSAAAEVRSAVADAGSALADAGSVARETALEAARQTPLRDHPALRRRPGVRGMFARLGLVSIVAAGVGLLLVYRDCVRRAVAVVRDRLADMAADRGIGTKGGRSTGEDVRGDAAGTDVEVDEVLMVESPGPSEPGADSGANQRRTRSDPTGPASAEAAAEPGAAPGGTPPADRPAGDLDAHGGGRSGTPTAPRRPPADVAAMTAPSAPGTAEAATTAEGEERGT